MMQQSSTQLKVLHHPSQILSAIPITGKMTALSRKLYLSILERTQESISHGGHVDASTFFSAPIRDLLEPVAEESDKDAVQRSKVLFKNMLTTLIEWSAPENTKKGIVWEAIPLLGRVQFEKKGGMLVANWQLNDLVLESLKAPMPYLRLVINELKALDSYSAVALYLICARYRDNPTGVTSVNTPEWWIRALRGEAKRKHKNARVIEWRHFKIEALRSAIAEINEKTPLTVELVEFKDGAKIISVQFKVAKKDVDWTSARPSPLKKRAALLGVSSSDISAFQAQGVNDDVIDLALAKLSARKENHKLDPIDNPSAYFRSEMNRQGSVRVDVADLSKSSAPQGSRGKDPEIASQLVPESAIKTPHQHVYELLIESGDGEIEKVIQNVLNDAQSSRLLNPSMRASLVAGKIGTGLIKSLVTKTYGEMVYGAQWLDIVNIKLKQQ